MKSEGKQTNTQLEQGLKELDVKKAEGLVFKAKDMDSQKLLEMRKENPARFDKIVLEVGQEKAPIAVSKKVILSAAVEKARAISSRISNTTKPSQILHLQNGREEVMKR